MRTRSALILGSLLLGGLTSCGGDGNGPNGTPKPGAIQGTLTSTAGAPIANASLQLLKADKSLLRATTTAANGTYGFLDVVSGNYFVRAHPPAGYAISPASDSLRAVQVTSGATTTVSLTVAGLTQAMDTVQAGEIDAIELASGASAVVQLPASVPTVSLRLNDTTVTLPTEFPPGGRSLSLTYQSAASTSDFDDPPATISLSIPVSGPAPIGGGQWVLYGKIYEDGQLQAEGPLTSSVGSAPAPSSETRSSRGGQASLVLNAAFTPPATGNTQLVVSATTSTMTCSGLPILYSDPADTLPLGSRKALILIHGIQLDHVVCAQVNDFNPATETFAALAPLIRQDPELRSTYKLYFYKYASFYSISSNGDELASQMQTENLIGVPNRVVIVGHSMGGLVARRALTNATVDTAVERLVTLATPHYGTPNADQNIDRGSQAVRGCYNSVYASSLLPGQWFSRRFLRWWLWRALSYLVVKQQSQGGDDLGSKSPFIASLPQPDSQVIPLAGRISLGNINHGISSIGVSSGLLHLGCILEVGTPPEFDHDGTVPFASAFPDTLAGNPLAAYYVGLDHIDMTGGGLTPSQPLLDHVLDLLRRGMAHDFQLVSGDGQTAPAGSALSQPIVVKALDQYGIGVAGITVTFTVTQGGGSFAGQAQVDKLTDQHGQASVDWTLGAQSGANTAEAAAESRPGVALVGSPVTFAATSTPGGLTYVSDPIISNYIGTYPSRQVYTGAEFCAAGIWSVNSNVLRDASGQIYRTTQLAGGIVGTVPTKISDLPQLFGDGTYLYLSNNSLSCTGITETVQGSAYLWVSVSGGTIADFTPGPLPPGQWADLPSLSLSHGLYDIAVAGIGNRLYVLGGAWATFSGGVQLAEVLRFDVSTSTWLSQAAPIPWCNAGAGTCIAGEATAVVNGLVYLVGGWGPSTAMGVNLGLRVYDPVANAWNTVSSLPNGGFGPIAGADPGSVLVLSCDVAQAATYFYRYDTVADTWSLLQQPPRDHCYGTGAMLNGLFYAVGGSSNASGWTNAVDVFNPQTNSWTPGPSLSGPRGMMGSTLSGNRLIVVGGIDQQGSVATVEQLDPVSGAWTELLPLVAPDFGMGAVALNQVLYVIGGHGGIPGFPGFGTPAVRSIAIPPSPSP